MPAHNTPRLFSPATVMRNLFAKKQSGPKRRKPKLGLRAAAEVLEDRVLLATFQVTTTDDSLADDGELSLREAIIAANENQNGTPDTIFLQAGTYQLTLPGRNEDGSLTGDLDILESVNIFGAGQDANGNYLTRIDASLPVPGGVGNRGIDRVFQIHPGRIGADGKPGKNTVSMTGVMITGGEAELGAGIYNAGTTTLIESTIAGNFSTIAQDDTPLGPAVYNLVENNTDLPPGGLLALSNTTVQGNFLNDGSLAQNFADKTTQTFRDNQDGFTEGIGEFFATLGGTLQDALDDVGEIPVLGDQLIEATRPVFDALDTAEGELVDLVDSILGVPDVDLGGLSAVELLRNTLFVAFADGDKSFDQISPQIRTVLEPYREQIASIGLGVLQDSLDTGPTVNPTDVIVTFGIDGYGETWYQLDVHLGQRIVLNLPTFEWGLGQATALLENDTISFADFGLNISSTNGLQVDARWDTRLGIGVSSLSAQKYFIDAGKSVNGTANGEAIEEFKFSVEAYAGPAPGALGFGEVFIPDPNDPTNFGFQADVNLGLTQATITDGTPQLVSITTDEGIGKNLLSPDDFSTNFIVNTYKSDGSLHSQAAINYSSPVGGELLPEFLLNINKTIIEAFGGEAPENLNVLELIDAATDADFFISLETSRINRFFSRPGADTTPSLIIKARDPDVAAMKIIGGEEIGFIDGQVDDGRARSIGFGNNVSSVADGDTQVLTAPLEATGAPPTNGRLISNVDFVIWLGGPAGEKTTQRVRINPTELAQRRFVDSLAELRQRLEIDIRDLVDGLTDYTRDRISLQIVDLDGNVIADEDVIPGGDYRFQLVSFADPDNANETLRAAPLLTVTYRPADQTKLQFAASIDVTKPGFVGSSLDDPANANDQRALERVTRNDLRGGTKSDFFVPSAVADAEIRLHFDTNSDGLVDFLSQQLGLGAGAIGLPSIEYDFLFDAAFDFTNLIRGDGESVIDVSPLAFDNIVLDVNELITGIITPIANLTEEVLAPVGEIVHIFDARLPVIGDILGEDVTLRSIIGNSAADTLIEALEDVANAGSLLTDYVNSPEFLADFGENGRLELGGLGVVTDSDSPLFLKPLPLELVELSAFIDPVDLEDFLSISNLIEKVPGVFKIDMLKPGEIFKFLTGIEPFTIVSFGFPQVDFRGTADFGFQFQDLMIDILATVDLDANLRLAYDSTGLERIVQAINSGGTPDFGDLLDGFFIHNNPNAPELGIGVSFVGEGSIDIPFFQAEGKIDVGGSLAFEIEDPNKDGKLRLDEILALTNDFEKPENLAFLFDLIAQGHVTARGSATVAGIDLGAGDIGLVSGEFSLQNLISSSFGLAKPIPPRQPALILPDGDDTVLRVNTGPFASARINGDTDDADATSGLTITVSEHETIDGQFTVTIQDPSSSDSLLQNGISETYSAPGGITRIDVVGSDFADTIDLRGVRTVDANIIGGAGDDLIYGGDGNDRIDGRSGNDEIHGGDGGDELLGDAGNDRIFGGRGDDDILGDAGDDELHGGDGGDRLFGGRGNDSIYGDAGDDLLQGSDGADLLNGGTGDDVIRGERGDDNAFGAAGDDFIDGGSGNDFLDGGDDHDLIIGGRGNDNLTGGGGDDELQGDAGSDTLSGGQGDDLLQGGSGDDTLTGGGGDDDLFGNAGNDMLTGDSGTDRLFGGLDDDSLHTTSDDSRADGGLGSDQLSIDATNQPQTATLTRNTFSTGGNSLLYVSTETITLNLGLFDDELTVTDAGGELELNTGGGTDQITIEGLSLPAFVNAGASGVDQISLRANSAAVAMETAGANLDVTVGSAEGLLTEIQAAVTLDATGSNNSRLTIDESGSLANRHAVSNGSTVTGLGNAGEFTYAGFAAFELLLGGGDDTLVVTGTHAGATTLKAGDGDDQFLVNHLGNSITLDGESGDDEFVLNAFLHDIALVGGSGSDEARLNVSNTTTSTNAADPGVTSLGVENLTVDNTLNANDFAWTLADSIITVGNRELVAFTGAQQTALLLGSGDDRVAIVSTDNATTIDAGGGDDTFSVGPVLSHLNGLLTLSGGAGVNPLTLNDTGNDDSSNRQAIDLIANSLGAGRIVGGDRDLSTGNITAIEFEIEYGGIIAAAGADHLDLTLGVGVDDLLIDGTSGQLQITTGDNADVVTINKTHHDLTVYLGDGGDLLTVRQTGANVSLHGEADGSTVDDELVLDLAHVAVNLQGVITDASITGLGLASGLTYDTFELLTVNLGAGSDELTLERTDADVTLNGGEGNDTIGVSATVGPVTINGGVGFNNDAGRDVATIVQSAGPTPVMGLTANVDLLRIDSTLTADGVQWAFRDGIVFADDGTGNEIQILDTLGAEEVEFLAGDGTDTLDVSTSLPTSQRILVEEDRVQFTDKSDVLEFESFQSDAGGRLVLDPATGILFTIDPDTSEIGIFEQDDDPASQNFGELTFTDRIGGWEVAQEIFGLDNVLGQSGTKKTKGRFGEIFAVDGDLMAVLAPTEETLINGNLVEVGSLSIFRNDGAQWVLEAKFFDAGFAVAVDAESNRVFVTDHDRASVGVYEFQNSLWSKTQTLTPQSSNPGTPGVDFQFGQDLAVEGDTLFVGGLASGFAGADGPENFWIFTRNAATGLWQQAQEISEPYLSFGSSVSIDGDVAVVGALRASSLSPTQIGGGLAFVYRRDSVSGVWSREAILSASETVSGDFFSADVDIQGDRIAIAAQGAANDRGTVYLFERDATTGAWNQTAKLTASDPGVNDRFGTSIDLDGERLIVGAPGNDRTNLLTLGSAYIFENTDNGWMEIQRFRLTDSETEGGDNLGDSVAIRGNIAYVGGGGAAGIVGDQGGVFVFEQTLIGAEKGAASHDGRHFYVTRPAQDSLLIYFRPNPGELSLREDFQTVALGLDGISDVVTTPEDHVYLLGQDDGLVGIYLRDPVDGSLSIDGGFSGFNSPTEMTLSSDGQTLYVLDHDGDDSLVYALDRNPGDGSLAFTPGNVITLNFPAADGQSLIEANGVIYVSSPATGEVAVIKSNLSGPGFTLLERVVNGSGGVVGLGGVTALAAMDEFLFAAGTLDSSIVVFTRQADGTLTFRDRIRNLAQGVTGLARPVSLSIHEPSGTLYVGSLDLGAALSGVARFSIDLNTASAARDFVVRHSGFENLNVQSGGGADSITLRDVDLTPDPEGRVVIEAGNGNDEVQILKTVTQQDTIVRLGTGLDQATLRALGGTQSITINGELGADSIDVRHVAENVTTVINGDGRLNPGPENEGSDVFRVAGASLFHAIEINGHRPSVGTIPGDTLLFDPQGFETLPATIPTGSGSVKVDDPAFAAVNYTSIETARIINPPIADADPAGGGYMIAEGESLTLFASALIPLGVDQLALVEWDINGDGVFNDAPAGFVSSDDGDDSNNGEPGNQERPDVTLSWSDLQNLGLNDDGTYVVTVRVTDGAGEFGEASAVLTIANVAPRAINVTPLGEIREGQPAVFQVTADDPAGAADPVTFAFDFDFDGIYELTNGTGVIEHIFDRAGDVPIRIQVRDDDGGVRTAVFAVSVNSAAPEIQNVSVTGDFIEGEPVDVSVSAMDFGSDPLSFEFDFDGDGMAEVTNGSGEASFVYDDDGTFALIVTVRDMQGNAVSQTESITIANADPRITSLVVNGGNPLTEADGPVSIRAAAADAAGDLDLTYRFQIAGGPELVSVTGEITFDFLDNGTYTVTVTVEDGDGGIDSYETRVTVANVDPTLALTGPESVDEGSIYQLELAGTDPGLDSIHEWQIDWGDGSVETALGNPTSIEHSYADDGFYTITATAIDEDGQHVADPLTVQVLNVAPALALSGLTAVDEGEFSLELSAIDPGDDTIREWYINWGDGRIETISGNPANAVHVYDGGADGSTYRITAQAMDEDGTFVAGNSLEVTVVNVAPVIDEVSLLTMTPIEGGQLSVRAFARDIAGELDPLVYEFDFDGDGLIDAVSNTGITHWTYPDDGLKTIAVRVSDGDGGLAESTFQIDVVDVAPSLVLRGESVVNEGSRYTLNLDVFDPGEDTLDGYTVDWGDGTIEQFTFSDGQPDFAPTHIYADGDAVITNVFTMTTQTTGENALFSLDLSAWDQPAGPADSITFWTIEWGDGNVESIAGDAALASHEYFLAGEYTVTATSNRLTTYTIRVFDLSDEESDHATLDVLDVAVRNVTPRIDISGNARAGDEVPYGLKLGPITDPGEDTPSGFVVDWGDGNVETFNRPPAVGETVFHTYTDASGPLTIRVLLIDEDGVHPSAQKLDIIVAGSALGDDGVLRIYGTDEKDVVHIKLKGLNHLEVKAHFLAGFKRQFDLEDVESIEVYLGDGNDHLHVHQKVHLPLSAFGEGGDDHLHAGDGKSHLDGGAGNDFLWGGDGDDIFVGGSGDDLLFGSFGDDLLVGGEDHDLLYGGLGDDLLVGGSVVFPPAESSWMGLNAILAEWTSGRSYHDRIDNLTGNGTGDGENGDYFLIPGETVVSDDTFDLLFGGLGEDWYFWDLLY